MSVLYGNAIVGQSGGPTAAINATLAGVILGAREAEKKGIIKKLYGMRNGIDGVLSDNLTDLFSAVPDKETVELLKKTPAAALGSCRKKLPDPKKDTDGVFEKILSIFKKYDIRYFFYIGGNDSMDTVMKLSQYMKKQDYEMRIMGVPKTIDNDLCGTDHTPGFGSAAKYIATTVSEFIRDCAVYTVPAVTIVEIMGRDAGWLTAASALSSVNSGECPDLIYLPERVFSMEEFLSSVRKALEKHPNVVVAVSEGVRFLDGTYVGASTQSGATDAFGHQYLAGTGKALEMAVKSNIGCKVRSVELNISQRCASHLASKADLDESVRVGKSAFRAAVSGRSGKMMCFIRKEGERYAVSCRPVDIRKIANMVKTVPDEFINAEGNHVTEACVRYLLPLIKGEVAPTYQNGIPVHFILK